MYLPLLPSHLGLRLQLSLVMTCWLINHKRGTGDNAHSILHDIKINNTSKLSTVVWWALVHSLILRATVYQMPSPHQRLCYVLESKCFLPFRTSPASEGGGGREGPNMKADGKSLLMEGRTESMAAWWEADQLCLEEMILRDTLQGHLGSCRMQRNICKGREGEMASWSCSSTVETNWIPFIFSYLL